MLSLIRKIYLSPSDDVKQALLDVADSATVSLYILIYAITLPELATIVLHKHRAGLHTGIVADRSQSLGIKQRALLQGLVDAGVPVTITTARTGQINHSKILLVDHELGVGHNCSYAVYGSVNFSEIGPLQNNHLTIENTASIVETFLLQYQDAETYGKAHVEQLAPTPPAPPAQKEKL